MLRGLNLREEAFPFDWVISFNGEKLIELIKDDFSHFFDNDVLRIGNGGELLNDYYQMEFIHDGDFRHPETLDKFIGKYQRRIQRFRQLESYRGKVYFFRFANASSMTDPYRYFFNEENMEISDDYALRLHQVLAERFHFLNFSLVILNVINHGQLEEEKRLLPTLIKLRGNPSATPSGLNEFFNYIQNTLLFIE